MSLRRARLHRFALPLVRPLATAHATLRVREGFLVELEGEDGRRGFGEATPLPDYGTEDLAACRAALVEGLARAIARGEPAGPAPGIARGASPGASPTAFRQADTPCAAGALDAAWHDLAARRGALGLAQSLRQAAGIAGAAAGSVRVQALVSGETPEEVARRATAARAAGHRAFKLKLAVGPGGLDPDLGLDRERVAALRDCVGGEAPLRLDANEAWSEAAAGKALEALADLGIDFVEQPVARHDLAGLARLSASSPIPLAADEALQVHALDAILRSRAAAVLVVKPALVGGATGALALHRRAGDAGLRVVWSTLVEGAVGRGLPLALAAGLGPEAEVHGVGTADLLAEDLAPPEAVVEGRIALRAGHGLGFEPRLPEAARGRAPDFEVAA